MTLPQGYEIRELTSEEIRPLWKQGVKDVFEDETCWLDMERALSTEEKSAQNKLKDRLKSRYELNLAIFHEGQMVAWSRGYQTSMDEFFMVNSGVYPKHRRKGLYALLLDQVVERVRAEGFQLIWSVHATTNNAVIIPKLKKGFAISGIDILEIYGVAVKLVYHFNQIRRETLDFRTGLKAPSKELKGLIRGISG